MIACSARGRLPWKQGSSTTSPSREMAGLSSIPGLVAAHRFKPRRSWCLCRYHPCSMRSFSDRAPWTPYCLPGGLLQLPKQKLTLHV